MLRSILVAVIAAFTIVAAEQSAMAAAGQSSGRVTGLAVDPSDPAGVHMNLRATYSARKTGYGPSVQLRRLATPRLPAGGTIRLRVR